MLGNEREDEGGSNGGAGYPAARYMMRPQWPNAGPWSKPDEQTDYYQQQYNQRHQHYPPRNFPVQNLHSFQTRPNHQRRPSSSPKPTLNLSHDRRQIPPDLLSPRSDSFFYASPNVQRNPTLTPTTSEFPSSSARMRAESNPASRPPPRSAFPGLSSNPFIVEAYEPEPEPESQQQLQPEPRSQPPSRPPSDEPPRKFPLLARHHEQIGAPMSPASMMSRFDSPPGSRRGTPTPSEGTVVTVENFSRPRKTSIRSQQSDGALSSRRMGLSRPQVETTMEEPGEYQGENQQLHAQSHAPGNPWPRLRRLSGSSSQSSSTFSSIAFHSSQDHAPRSETPRNMNAPIAALAGPFARSVLGPSSSGTQAYAREEQAAQQQQQQRQQQQQQPPQPHHPHAQPREPPPWLSAPDETLRSSFRSQLTSSTAQGTLFTATGTERNSVVTKASSVGDHQSITNIYARASWWHNSIIGDDGLLEDVMGMYERGFNDSDIESVRKSMRFADDEDIFAQADLDNPMPRRNSSRPASSHHSDADVVKEKILEAMNDSLPSPTGIAIPMGSPGSRQSVPKFRQSLLPTNSLPKDFGFGMAAQHIAKRNQAEPEGLGKHDSAKSVGAENAQVSAEEQEDDRPISPLSPVPPPLPIPTEPASRPTTPSRAPPPMPQEPPEEPGSRDRYGFRKAGPNVTRQAYDAWNAGYTEYLSRRRKKWVAFLKDNSLMTDRPIRFPPRSNKTKRFIRKGIPPDWRGAAWFYYAGGPAILSKHRGVYDHLLKRAALDPNGPGSLPGQTGEVKPLIVDDIEKDLYRTFPDNVKFKPPREAQPPPPSPDDAGDEPAAPDAPAPEPDIIASLRRVLHAFALYNPRIGYCQSLNFLAGLLLLFVETEEQAFWLLNVITRVYLPGTHEMSLEGSKVDLGVLMVALKDSLPNVWKQIGGDEDMALGGGKKKPKRGLTSSGHRSNQSVSDPNRLPAITLCMTAWFMSCFIGTLPIETVLRVWDVFFYEGSRTLFRVALTIFKLGEPEIKAVQDPMEMFGVVQQFPRKLLDANALMDLCYKRRNGIGHLSQDDVEEKRQERRDGIRRWKAEQEAAALSAGGGGGGGGGNKTRGLDLAGGDNASERKVGVTGGGVFGRGKNNREQARAAEVM
ncbi:putative GTPase-activating protein [Triangularia verruculosa]|uniref:GTPase-activating protein n=1 Tax=Triangularia verruculosa TaxID=2587418 RepID=A0AAN6X9V1_9PEZI|nr:putative GTPase-activating protein [Triangularia verruculosa]